MQVTRIEPVGKNRSRIYVDETIFCILYNRELSGYGIREGEELSEDSYHEILGELLPKRAKMRVMYLLGSMDRTEQQLRRKLREGDYPESVIDEAVAYVQNLHYQDDRRYAGDYVDFRKKNKSRWQLKRELYQKGISSDLAEEMLEQYRPEEERNVIRALLARKGYEPVSATREEQRKIYGFLLRKGFRTEDILAVMHLEEEY